MTTVTVQILASPPEQAQALEELNREIEAVTRQLCELVAKRDRLTSESRPRPIAIDEVF